LLRMVTFHFAPFLDAKSHYLDLCETTMARPKLRGLARAMSRPTKGGRRG
jgi:hypothetical protein